MFGNNFHIFKKGCLIFLAKKRANKPAWGQTNPLWRISSMQWQTVIVTTEVLICNMFDCREKNKVCINCLSASAGVVGYIPECCVSIVTSPDWQRVLSVCTGGQRWTTHVLVAQRPVDVGRRHESRQFGLWTVSTIPSCKSLHACRQHCALDPAADQGNMMLCAYTPPGRHARLPTFLIPQPVTP